MSVPAAHSHTHGHSPGPAHAHRCGPGRRRALWWALGLNAGFLVVEIVGGVLFDSLALLADAAHMGSDVVALGVALVAFGVAARPASARHTYGLPRAEVLAAQANAVVLIVVAVGIVVEAIGRAGDPPPIDGRGVMVVAAVGLAINVASAVVLARTAGTNLNLRGAVWHMVADALGSLAALAAGFAAVAWGVSGVDVIASVVVAGLVVWGGWRLLAAASQVLLEAVPAHLDRDEVVEAIAACADVESVHHVHLWSLGSESVALSAHVVLATTADLHTAETRVRTIKAELERRFAIAHATIEVECHPCEPGGAGAPAPS